MAWKLSLGIGVFNSAWIRVGEHTNEFTYVLNYYGEVTPTSPDLIPSYFLGGVSWLLLYPKLGRLM
jgi:hypothetical protein